MSFAKIAIEVCAGSFLGAVDAQRGGADRIELNQALELDGLTPSAGLTERVLGAVEIPVIAMARPRGGDFCYSDSEWETLIADARWLLRQGVSGIAFGCLGADGRVDQARCRQMRELADSRELVFHKAFDEVVDWEAGLDCLIQTGVDRVMTSGQMDTALAGAAKIAQFVTRAKGRIEVIPAGRIGATNAVEIVRATSCSQIHGSFSGGENCSVFTEIGRVAQQLAANGSSIKSSSQAG